MRLLTYFPFPAPELIPQVHTTGNLALIQRFCWRQFVTFREGLLKARGQIAFVTALVLSTAFIIYLETLDTEERIQSRVSAELARQRGAPASVSPSLVSAVTTAMRRAQEAYKQEPDTAANRASLLTSVSSAVQLGIIGSSEGHSQIERILDDMERKPEDKPAERNVTLASALAVTAATFPTLQDRVSRLLPQS
jgi:hypothetical protein